MNKERALIFDMDGVIIDNHIYHMEAWILFAKKYGLHLSEEEYKQKINGRTMGEIINLFFPLESNPDTIKKLGNEKEQCYRDLYFYKRKLMDGLFSLLKECKQKHIPCGIGSSAPPENISFIIEHFQIRKYFQSTVNGNQVVKGKPNPEVYLKVAKEIGISPEKCVVFEDALSGIQAAKSAGMKTIGVATTHLEHELSHTDMVIKNFLDLSIEKINTLFVKPI